VVFRIKDPIGLAIPLPFIGIGVLTLLRLAHSVKTLRTAIRFDVDKLADNRPITSVPALIRILHVRQGSDSIYIFIW
jgi:hypothetical protein